MEVVNVSFVLKRFLLIIYFYHLTSSKLLVAVKMIILSIIESIIKTVKVETFWGIIQEIMNVIIKNNRDDGHSYLSRNILTYEDQQ